MISKQELIHRIFMKMKAECGALKEVALIGTQDEGTILIGQNFTDMAPSFAEMLLPSLVKFENFYKGTEIGEIDEINLFLGDTVLLIKSLQTQGIYLLVAFNGNFKDAAQCVRPYFEKIKNVIGGNHGKSFDRR